MLYLDHMYKCNGFVYLAPESLVWHFSNWMLCSWCLNLKRLCFLLNRILMWDLKNVLKASSQMKGPNVYGWFRLWNNVRRPLYWLCNMCAETVIICWTDINNIIQTGQCLYFFIVINYNNVEVKLGKLDLLHAACKWEKVK